MKKKEVLLALLISCILLLVLLVWISESKRQDSIDAALTEVSRMHESIERFHRARGGYPESNSQLVAWAREAAGGGTPADRNWESTWLFFSKNHLGKHGHAFEFFAIERTERELRIENFRAQRAPYRAVATMTLRNGRVIPGEQLIPEAELMRFLSEFKAAQPPGSQSD